MSWKQRLTGITCFITLWVLHCQSQQHRLYFKRQDTCPGQVLLEDNCPDSFRAKRKAECAQQCGQRVGCSSFVWDADTRVCQLCNTAVTDQCNNTRPSHRQVTFQQRCIGQEERNSTLCQCPLAWDGDRCQNRMTDCADWKSAGYTGHRVVWIHPVLSPNPFPMMCQLAWNRGVVMTRWSGTPDFYRDWEQYAEGFGDVSGNHWLGLRKVHQLTQSRCYMLVVQLNLANSTYYQRYYRNFTVSGERQHFVMDFNSSFHWVNFLGDCLSDVRGKPFSTYDADHDDADGSCAERHHSGWWFGNCTLCNPTGELVQPMYNTSRTSDRQAFWTPGLVTCCPED
ncbi:microfibril-associated glycoprotein 4-like [Babylonia areolata]|uniref:microfibril-associated glycoprotein 4-like n=1 Tax=Babylonia areolata TaxID=304850 RepID=UPI003FD5EA14